MFNAKGFKRWLFGSSRFFDSQIAARTQLIGLFVLLLSLVFLNAIVTYAAGDKFFHTNGNPHFSAATFESLTGVAGFYLYTCACLAGAFYIFMKGLGDGILRKAILWLLLLVFALATVLSVVAMIPYLFDTHFSSNTYSNSSCFTNFWGMIHEKLSALVDIAATYSIKYWWMVWGGLLVMFWFARKFLIQYMGDVAAYVDSYSLDRFDEMRKQIKKEVLKVAKAVYAQDYQRIAVVGHSLGSVIAYDALNAMIVHDELNPIPNKLDVVERTSLLLTFGSPLDKIAFIFANQSNKTTDTREALAASKQPLIQKYQPNRNIRWFNVYSPQDVISGKLNFYDNPSAEGYAICKAVKNVVDPDANIPVMAHTKYWTNPTLFDHLYNNL